MPPRPAAAEIVEEREDGELDPEQVKAFRFKLGFSETEKLNWR